VSASQLKGSVFDRRPLSESPQCFLGKSAHPNRTGEKQISGFGLRPIAVTKIKKSTNTSHISSRLSQEIRNQVLCFPLNFSMEKKRKYV